MNSTLKPVLAAAVVPQGGGQASPAKATVAGVNHAGHPQGAQNSLHHASNNLVGQNLTQHAPPAPAPAAPPPAPAHLVPSLAPVSANMAQMAQNMSHHGNLSHMGQNSVAPANTAASPSKSAGTPLSLVQDKASPSQPLALTRTPEKKEAETASAQANGTIDSPKSAASAPTTLKPQNPEPNKEKQDIAKTSPSTPKPPEKPTSAPNTPQKLEPSNAVGQADGPTQPKVATASEPPEKSPSKPSEPKPMPSTADVAPIQTDHKPTPESANDSQSQEKPVVQNKAGPQEKEDKSDAPTVKLDVKKEEPKPVNPVAPVQEDKKAESNEPEKKVKPDPVVEPIAEQPKTQEVKTPVAKVVESKLSQKSTMKLATVTPPLRKRRQTSPSKGSEGVAPPKKVAEESTPDNRSKRNRTKVQLYQSPTPELTMATKLSASAGRSTPTKPNDDKLIVFYKNEYLAVRNAEGGFYVCQTTQNVYRTTRKIKIRWLSQDKATDPSGETYKPDFYDVTDMECVLTTLSLQRTNGGAQLLKAAEAARARSILHRALQHERGQDMLLTPEHPDGLDLSLYTDESQIEKKSRKRNSSKSSPRGKQSAPDDDNDAPPSAKRTRTTPKKSGHKAKSSPKIQNNKRKSTGSTPPVAPPSKTATVTDKATPAKVAKRTPVKPPKPAKVEPVVTPIAKPKRNTRELKPSPIVPTPSTSTGKTTRTPRKPPANK